MAKKTNNKRVKLQLIRSYSNKRGLWLTDAYLKANPDHAKWLIDQKIAKRFKAPPAPKKGEPKPPPIVFSDADIPDQEEREKIAQEGRSKRGRRTD